MVINIRECFFLNDKSIYMINSRQPQKKYKYPHEVFADLAKIDSFHDRANHLRSNSSFAIRTILQCNFTPSIRLDLPDGAPPFNRDGMPLGNSLGRIDKAIKVLGRIAIMPGQTPSVGIARIKKETLFIQLLESVNEKDADVIIVMKEKSLTSMYPILDETLVKAAFPDLI